MNESRIVNGPRMVRDRTTGEIITVIERRADNVAGARGPACLVFSTDAGFRRLWDYPAQWLAFGDDELLALSEYRANRNSRSA